MKSLVLFDMNTKALCQHTLFDLIQSDHLRESLENISEDTSTQNLRTIAKNLDRLESLYEDGLIDHEQLTAWLDRLDVYVTSDQSINSFEHELIQQANKLLVPSVFNTTKYDIFLSKQYNPNDLFFVDKYTLQDWSWNIDDYGSVEDFFLAILHDLNDYFANNTTIHLKAGSEILLNTYDSSDDFFGDLNNCLNYSFQGTSSLSIQSYKTENDQYIFNFTYKGEAFQVSLSKADFENIPFDETPKSNVFLSELDEQALYDTTRLYTELSQLLEQDEQVTKIIINTEEERACYSFFEEALIIPTKAIYQPNTVVHEFAHVYFATRLLDDSYSNTTSDPLWQDIFALSLSNGSYELVDDSNYIPNAEEKYGHPSDNPNEFFASSFHAFYCYPEDFAQTILEGNEKEQKVGIMIWCFLRDEVFEGTMPSGEDPFSDYSLDDFTITDEEIQASLETAILEPNDETDPNSKEIEAAKESARFLLRRYLGTREGIQRYREIIGEK